MAWTQSQQRGHLLLRDLWARQVLGVSNDRDCGRSGEKGDGGNAGGSWHGPAVRRHVPPGAPGWPHAFCLPLHEDHEGWLRSCCLSRAALCLSHSVSLPVPSLLLVFPEKKVQFQRSVNVLLTQVCRLHRSKEPWRNTFHASAGTVWSWDTLPTYIGVLWVIHQQGSAGKS